MKLNINKKTLLITCLILLVCFCTIASIIALILIPMRGVATVQSSQRDTERKSIIQKVNLELLGYYSQNVKYPQTIIFDKSFIQVGNSKIELEKYTSACDSGIATSSECTVYCYEALGDSSYRLGVSLESSEWGEIGSSQQLGNDSSACAVPHTVKN